MVCHGKLLAGLHFGWTLTWGQKAQFLWDSKGKQNHRNSQLEGDLASEENQVQGQRAICMCFWPKMSCSEVSPNLLSTVLLPMRILCSLADSRGLGVPAPETSRRITLQREDHVSPHFTCFLLTSRTLSPERCVKAAGPSSCRSLLPTLPRFLV